MNLRHQCLVLLVAASILATDAPKASSVEGTVTLNSVAALPGVTIGLDSLARGRHIQKTANTSGYYVFEEMRPGAYTTWADAKGTDASSFRILSCTMVSAFGKTLISPEERLMAGVRPSKRRRLNEHPSIRKFLRRAMTRGMDSTTS